MGGTDEPLVWYEGAATTDRRFLQADERGSVIAVSDSAGGSLAINRYDEYGIPQVGNAGRFQYTGQVWLPETGLYWYKARMYSPSLGRFMQTDPIGYGDGLNWYGYVGGDPVNRTDPTGLKCPISEHCTTVYIGDGGTMWISGGDSSASNDGDITTDNWVKVTTVKFDSLSAIYNFDRYSDYNVVFNPDDILSDTKACQQLRKDSEATQSALPPYVTDNKNWDDASAIQGYRNLYQDSFKQYDAVSGPIASTLITATTTAFSFTPWGKGAKMAIATAAATQGASLSLSALKDAAGAKVTALDARIKVLGAGCE